MLSTVMLKVYKKYCQNIVVLAICVGLIFPLGPQLVRADVAQDVSSIVAGSGSQSVTDVAALNSAFRLATLPGDISAVISLSQSVPALFTSSMSLTSVMAVLGPIGIIAGVVTTVLSLAGVFDSDPSGAQVARSEEYQGFGECLAGKIQVVNLVKLKSDNQAKIAELKSKGLVPTSSTGIETVRTALKVLSNDYDVVKKIADSGIIQGQSWGVDTQTATILKKYNLPFAAGAKGNQVLSSSNKALYVAVADQISKDVTSTLLKIIDPEIARIKSETNGKCSNYCVVANNLINRDTVADGYSVAYNKYKTVKNTSGATTAQIDAARTDLSKVVESAYNKLFSSTDGKVARYYVHHLSAAIKTRNSSTGLARVVASYQVWRLQYLISRELTTVKEYSSYLASNNSLSSDVKSNASLLLDRYANGTAFTPYPSLAICGSDGKLISAQTSGIGGNWFTRAAASVWESITGFFK